MLVRAVSAEIGTMLVRIVLAEIGTVLVRTVSAEFSTVRARTVSAEIGTVVARTVSAEIGAVLVRTVSAEMGTVLVRTVSAEISTVLARTVSAEIGTHSSLCHTTKFSRPQPGHTLTNARGWGALQCLTLQPSVRQHCYGRASTQISVLSSFRCVVQLAGRLHCWCLLPLLVAVRLRSTL